MNKKHLILVIGLLRAGKLFPNTTNFLLLQLVGLRLSLCKA